MQYYITSCIGGFIGYDEDMNIIEYELFNKESIPLKMIKIRNKEFVDEEINIINKIIDKFNNNTIDNIENDIIDSINDDTTDNIENDIIDSINDDTTDSINIESNKRLSDYKRFEDNDKINTTIKNKGGEYLRSNLNNELIAIGFANKEEINSEIGKQCNKIAILEMKESSKEEDKLLIQSINSLEEIDESISKLVERIREWYAIYFPELEIVNNNDVYVRLISDFGNRDEIIEKRIEELNIDIAISNGAEIEEEDLEMIVEFAKSIRSLQISRKNIENYIDMKMGKVAPNLKNLVGSSLGAKLIAHVGSIKKLAAYPSGTVQIMGAEKALFRHLKTGENPPKHGLIFQHPEVRGAKWWVRGKIARTLALKISLAVRKDVFSGDIDPNLYDSFIEKVEKINRENPINTKTSKRRQEERGNFDNSYKKDKTRNKKDKKNRKNKKNKYKKIHY
ncbi:NOP5/NOP56 family protein [Methanobrevibacter filiformis]|uniref:Putative snoRNA binding domain protein n=1 Tax=Methanobrevibacter filiformis TaxID=55758 RepID=A0A166APM7_9EURY|nr:hypothetical protein [Methanobrevibacter filiformis]KZX12308.1 putative snoRNA binding domain protein [Methanobrevibacter filiformis]